MNRHQGKRILATWYLTPGGNVRVVITRWAGSKVDHQVGITVRNLRDAWHLVTAEGAVHPRKAADPLAFKGWARLGKRG